MLFVVAASQLWGGCECVGARNANAGDVDWGCLDVGRRRCSGVEHGVGAVWKPG